MITIMINDHLVKYYTQKLPEKEKKRNAEPIYLYAKVNTYHRNKNNYIYRNSVQSNWTESL